MVLPNPVTTAAGLTNEQITAAIQTYFAEDFGTTSVLFGLMQVDNALTAVPGETVNLSVVTADNNMRFLEETEETPDSAFRTVKITAKVQEAAERFPVTNLAKAVAAGGAFDPIAAAGRALASHASQAIDAKAVETLEDATAGLQFSEVSGGAKLTVKSITAAIAALGSSWNPSEYDLIVPSAQLGVLLDDPQFFEVAKMDPNGNFWRTGLMGSILGLNVYTVPGVTAPYLVRRGSLVFSYAQDFITTYSWDDKNRVHTIFGGFVGAMTFNTHLPSLRLNIG